MSLLVAVWSNGIGSASKLRSSCSRGPTPLGQANEADREDDRAFWAGSVQSGLIISISIIMISSSSSSSTSIIVIINSTINSTIASTTTFTTFKVFAVDARFGVGLQLGHHRRGVAGRPVDGHDVVAYSNTHTIT